MPSATVRSRTDALSRFTGQNHSDSSPQARDYPRRQERKGNYSTTDDNAGVVSLERRVSAQSDALHHRRSGVARLIRRDTGEEAPSLVLVSTFLLSENDER